LLCRLEIHRRICPFGRRASGDPKLAISRGSARGPVPARLEEVVPMPESSSIPNVAHYLSRVKPGEETFIDELPFATRPFNVKAPIKP
jgi:hypothetical protein